MAERASFSSRRLARWGVAGPLVCAVAACSAVSDPAGFGIVTQDKYDFSTCPEILGARSGQAARAKELTELIEKAESDASGYVISAGAYRSELVAARAQAAAADRAAKLKGCDAPAKK